MTLDDYISSEGRHQIDMAQDAVMRQFEQEPVCFSSAQLNLSAAKDSNDEKD